MERQNEANHMYDKFQKVLTKKHSFAKCEKRESNAKKN